MSIRRDQRITLFTAVVTFVALSAVAIGVWAVNRPAPPAGSPDRIALAEFKRAYDRNEIVVIDVRGLDQYEASHIPGALQIPLARIEGEVPYLPKDKVIVTYCTCPAEETSGEAAMILARGGIEARALLGGLGAWTEAGYPVAAGLK